MKAVVQQSAEQAPLVVNAPTPALGVLGMPGFTAYSGMKVIGRPKAGETVVVAAASGGDFIDMLAGRNFGKALVRVS